MGGVKQGATRAAVVPYAAAAAVGVGGPAAAMAGPAVVDAELQQMREEQEEAAVQLHPHAFRHLLDCSEDLCDDDDCIRIYGHPDADDE